MLPEVKRLPRGPGVYRFRDERGTTLYLGRATDLRSRVASYWSQRDRPRLRRMLPRATRVEVLTCDSVHEASWLERNLLEARKPRWNRVIGGQESPLYLCVEAGGVRVSRTSGFGPFLGGNQTRLALSALHRLHPLAYARSNLTGAEADMAAIRGVGPADRDRLTAAVTAVLRRDPGAVTEALAGLATFRDRAAAELSFELAQRIQDEMAALTWVTSPQRVTVPGGGDLVVEDWAGLGDRAGGVRLRLEITAGHVRSWTVTRSAHPPAAPPPPAWADFTRRNAELAAALVTREG